MFGHNKDVKKVIEKVTHLSGPQAQDELKNIQDLEKELFEVMRSENSVLRGFSDKITEADKWLAGVTVKDLMAKKADAFTRVKVIIGQLGESAKSISEMIEKTFPIEGKVRKHAEDLGHEETARNFRLFERDERNMREIAEKVARKASTFKDEIFTLQTNENGAWESKEALEQRLKDAHRSLLTLRKNTNKLIAQFNHAIDQVENLSKDIIWKKLLDEHLYFMQKGVYPVKTDTSVAGENQRLYASARSNFNDPLYGKDTSRSQLMAYNAEKYGKDLEQLKVKKTG